MQKETPFDVIVSGYSIHHQPDARKRSIYAEIFSLLKPEGWFINIEHIAASAQITVDLLNNHVIDERYAIEKANGGNKTRQEVADIFLNRPDKDRTFCCRLKPNAIGCVRSVSKKWIVISASMNWLSSADAAQNKYYRKKMIWLNLIH